MIKNFKKDLFKKSNKKKAKLLQRFFKTGKGEYGEGDIFLGIMVPEQRKIAFKYFSLTQADLKKSIKSKYHEERLVSLLILVFRFEKGNLEDKKKVYDFYIKNIKYINNWDLVDLSAPKIVGAFLENKNKSILYKFARSRNLWKKRISMLSCFYYIHKSDCKDAIKIAKILKDDDHDLIQKAVGWMLREVGKRCSLKAEEDFLQKYYKKMPRTMLRYAIEKFPEKKRKQYLKR
ncbi:DNA alkylation repair protein [Patescibacteria group bacterium]